MKEHPIIFSTDMVKAILEGRKAQTRRVIKPQPKEYGVPLMKQLHWKLGTKLYNPPDLVPFCPYGQVGDRLWVRETWKYLDKEHKKIAYKASIDTYTDGAFIRLGNWKPSIHLFRKDSRITLEITEVRVKRLQEIGEEDAHSEGCINTVLSDMYPDFNIALKPASYNFRELWDSINAKRGYSWESNPWVWVIGFNMC